ncbi:hypothetical protein [uncultured Methanoregula sp.]|uniref:hypothetical protein n=1 Tax=uncultured Methanoregula sp. TaxID=1005933 RepID=UPI002AAACE45|nr:hypothetical protein [uncultured Methanoregula sp.]
MNFDKFEIIIALWMSLVLCTVVSFFMPVINLGSVSLHMFLEGFILSFVISMTASLVLPLKPWGDGIAAACKIQPPGLLHHLVSTAVVALIMATIMSLFMVWYFLPPVARPYFLTGWLKQFPYFLILIYLSGLVAGPVGIWIAKKGCHLPEK